MIFRFETAIEDKDVESTKILQTTLVRLMKSTMNWQKNNGQEVSKELTTQVADFETYDFAFAANETKKEVEMKGIPSAFLKALN